MRSCMKIRFSILFSGMPDRLCCKIQLNINENKEQVQGKLAKTKTGIPLLSNPQDPSTLMPKAMFTNRYTPCLQWNSTQMLLGNRKQTLKAIAFGNYFCIHISLKLLNSILKATNSVIDRVHSFYDATQKFYCLSNANFVSFVTEKSFINQDQFYNTNARKSIQCQPCMELKTPIISKSKDKLKYFGDYIFLESGRYICRLMLDMDLNSQDFARLCYC